MSELDKLAWKYRGTIERKAFLVSKDLDRREVLIMDMEKRVPIIVDVPRNVSLEKIEEGKTYNVRLRVYVAKQTPEFKRKLNELARNDPKIRETVKVLKKLGGGDILYKFELAGIRYYYFDVIKKGLDSQLDYYMRLWGKLKRF